MTSYTQRHIFSWLGIIVFNLLTGKSPQDKGRGKTPLNKGRGRRESGENSVPGKKGKLTPKKNLRTAPKKGTNKK